MSNSPDTAPTTPTAREQWWMDFHQAFMARKAAGPIDLLFVGDSITQAWAAEGKAVWDREYARLNAANFGIGGDETQHVLWRLDNGEIDGISPKLVVLMLGTNNLGNSGHTAGQVSAGLLKVIDTIVTKLPTSKLLVLGVFPRDHAPGTPYRKSIIEINKTLAARADQQRVWFFDVGQIFLKPDGWIDKKISGDSVHLSPLAYQMWADALRPWVEKLMG